MSEMHPRNKKHDENCDLPTENKTAEEEEIPERGVGGAREACGAWSKPRDKTCEETFVVGKRWLVEGRGSKLGQRRKLGEGSLLVGGCGVKLAGGRGRPAGVYVCVRVEDQGGGVT